ncbi:MAG: acyl-protein synthetase, partial [Verrucomicrobia bacterium]|nr:acyl-protein synthetase [Verrucomicrobiota bacterium]
MELIWDDLRKHVDTLEMPTAHKQLLDSRQERVSSGKATIQ